MTSADARAMTLALLTQSVRPNVMARASAEVIVVRQSHFFFRKPSSVLNER